MTHATEPISATGEVTLERETIFECPTCGTCQPVSPGTLHLIQEGVVTVCCGPEVVAPAPGPAMPKELAVMPA